MANKNFQFNAPIAGATERLMGGVVAQSVGSADRDFDGQASAGASPVHHNPGRSHQNRSRHKSTQAGKRYVNVYNNGYVFSGPVSVTRTNKVRANEAHIEYYGIPCTARVEDFDEGELLKIYKQQATVKNNRRTRTACNQDLKIATMAEAPKAEEQKKSKNKPWYENTTTYIISGTVLGVIVGVLLGIKSTKNE